MRQEVPGVDEGIPDRCFQIVPTTRRPSRCEPNVVFAFLRRALNLVAFRPALGTLDFFGVIKPFHGSLSKAGRNGGGRFTPGRELCNGQMRLVCGE